MILAKIITWIMSGDGALSAIFCGSHFKLHKSACQAKKTDDVYIWDDKMVQIDHKFEASDSRHESILS